jgi:hypothetical protein
MFRTVGIEQNFPRDIKTLNANLYEGLQLSNAMGYLLVIVGIICFVAAIFKTKMVIPYVLAVVVIAIGLWLLQSVRSTYQTRRNCFDNGTLVSANVVHHSQSFGKFQITLDLGGESIVVSHSSQDLLSSCPIGATVLGLKDNNKHFFGPEIGCLFTEFVQK